MGQEINAVGYKGTNELLMQYMKKKDAFWRILYKRVIEEHIMLRILIACLCLLMPITALSEYAVYGMPVTETIDPNYISTEMLQQESISGGTLMSVATSIDGEVAFSYIVPKKYTIVSVYASDGTWKYAFSVDGKFSMDVVTAYFNNTLFLVIREHLMGASYMLVQLDAYCKPFAIYEMTDVHSFLNTHYLYSIPVNGYENNGIKLLEYSKGKIAISNINGDIVTLFDDSDAYERTMRISRMAEISVCLLGIIVVCLVIIVSRKYYDQKI